MHRVLRECRRIGETRRKRQLPPTSQSHSFPRSLRHRWPRTRTLLEARLPIPSWIPLGWIGFLILFQIKQWVSCARCNGPGFPGGSSGLPAGFPRPPPRGFLAQIPKSKIVLYCFALLWFALFYSVSFRSALFWISFHLHCVRFALIRAPPQSGFPYSLFGQHQSITYDIMIFLKHVHNWCSGFTFQKCVSHLCCK